MPDAPTVPAPLLPESLYDRVTRRRFVVTAGWGIFGAYLAAAGGALQRYLFPNILYEPATMFKIGRVADYQPNSVSEKWLKDYRIWVIRETVADPRNASAKIDGIFAMWARCTHLGCTPRWFGSENRFRCPCHGSNYNRNGDVIAGPAPRSLFRCKIWLNDEGEIVVDRGVAAIKSTSNETIRTSPPYFLVVGKA